jgi:hypothetical protein
MATQTQDAAGVGNVLILILFLIVIAGRMEWD